MRNPIYFVYLLSVLALAISGCEAETQNPIMLEEATLSTALGAPLFQSQPSSGQDEARERLQAFRETLSAASKGSGLRVTGTSLEDAAWGVEALLNANYAVADWPIEAIDKETALVPTGSSGGNLSGAQLLALRDSTLSVLEAHLNKFAGTARSLALVDVSQEEDNGEVYFKIDSYVRKAPDPSGAGPTGVFDEDDYWYFSHGKCGPFDPNGNGPAGSGPGAADKLMLEVNLRVPLPSNHLFFTDIELMELDPASGFPFNLVNPDDDVPGDSYRDYLVYYLNLQASNASELSCLSPSEMAWYYSNIQDIAQQAAPSGKMFAILDLWPTWIPGQLGLHSGLLYYGTSVSCPCAAESCIIEHPGGWIALDPDCQCC